MVIEDAELANSIRDTAKTEIRRQEWASRRGIATRAYIREHSEVVEEFEKTATIAAEDFPRYVTRASVLLELRMRAARKEKAQAVKQWRIEHPEEAKKLAESVRESYNG